MKVRVPSWYVVRYDATRRAWRLNCRWFTVSLMPPLLRVRWIRTLSDG